MHVDRVGLRDRAEGLALRVGDREGVCVRPCVQLRVGVKVPASDREDVGVEVNEGVAVRAGVGLGVRVTGAERDGDSVALQVDREALRDAAVGDGEALAVRVGLDAVARDRVVEGVPVGDAVGDALGAVDGENERERLREAERVAVDRVGEGREVRVAEVLGVRLEVRLVIVNRLGVGVKVVRVRPLREGD